MSPSALMKMNSCQVLDIVGLGKLPTFTPDPDLLVPLYGAFNPRTATPQERVDWFNALPSDPRPIPDCPGYFVNKYGEFFKTKNGGRVALPGSFNQGRQQVALRRTDGSRWQGMRVCHAAVYVTFVGPLVYRLVVDHINDDPYVNTAFNVQLLTDSENRRKSKTAHTGVPRRRSGFVLLYPDGVRLYFNSGLKAGRAAGCNSRRIYDAADFGTKLRSGVKVERCELRKQAA